MKKIILTLITVVSVSALAEESSSYQPTPVGNELDNFDLRDVPQATSSEDANNSVYGPVDEEVLTAAREECQQNKSYRICANIRPPTESSDGRRVCRRGEELIRFENGSNLSAVKIKERRSTLGQLTEGGRGGNTYYGLSWCIPTN